MRDREVARDAEADERDRDGQPARRREAAADGEFALRRLERANADATRLRVNSTPTFTVAKGDGAPKVIGSGVLGREALAKALR